MVRLYPRLDEASIDSRVLGYTLLILFITTLLFGAAPALMGSRQHPNEALKDSARSSAGSSTQRWRSALVICQISLAFVLLVGTGLMLRNFLHLRAVDPGFDSDNLLTFQLQLGREVFGRRSDETFKAKKSCAARVEGREGPLLGLPG